MDSYLSKPFNMVQLQNVLQQWLAVKPYPNAPSESANATGGEQTTALPVISTNGDSVLNPNALDNLRKIRIETGETLLNKVIRLFLQSAPATLDDLRRALSQHDLLTLRKTAHGFKSVCANIGADVLSECCAALENLAKQDDIASAPEFISTMEQHLPKVIQALTQELVAGGSSDAKLTQAIQPELSDSGI